MSWVKDEMPWIAPAKRGDCVYLIEGVAVDGRRRYKIGLTNGLLPRMQSLAHQKGNPLGVPLAVRCLAFERYETRRAAWRREQSLLTRFAAIMCGGLKEREWLYPFDDEVRRLFVEMRENEERSTTKRRDCVGGVELMRWVGSNVPVLAQTG